MSLDTSRKVLLYSEFTIRSYGGLQVENSSSKFALPGLFLRSTHPIPKLKGLVSMASLWVGLEVTQIQVGIENCFNGLYYVVMYSPALP